MIWDGVVRTVDHPNGPALAFQGWAVKNTSDDYYLGEPVGPCDRRATSKRFPPHIFKNKADAEAELKPVIDTRYNYAARVVVPWPLGAVEPPPSTPPLSELEQLRGLVRRLYEARQRSWTLHYVLTQFGL